MCTDHSTASTVIPRLARHLRNRGSILSNGEAFFYWKTPIEAPGPTYPSIKMRSRALSTGIKQQACEADHSLDAEGRNEMNFTLTLDMPSRSAQGF